MSEIAANFKKIKINSEKGINLIKYRFIIAKKVFKIQ